MNEVENTYRALRDEEPLATGRWCWLSWHKWTKWSKPLHRKEGGYDIDYQTRYCVHCGSIAFKQLRRY
jgi:hypothetical protein